MVYIKKLLHNVNCRFNKTIVYTQILMSSEYDKPFGVVLKKSLFGMKEYTWSLVIYTVAIGILSLATPITVQSLVNTFALSTDVKPLANLSLMLLVLLIFYGFIKSFQYITVELMQQKLVAQLSVVISKKVIFGPRAEFQKHNIREKVNRFFEIITIQKLVAMLVTDGLSILIQTFIGLILLSLYHPFFIPFNILIAVVIVFVFRTYNSKAKISSIKESTAKFAVAGFLQDIAATESRLQNEDISLKLAKHSDSLIQNYIIERKEHFKVLFSQSVIYLALYAVLNAALLGLGGYLITLGQLSVGQLVAAEIIINGISIQLVYAMKHLQLVYDLYSSCDKLNWLIEIKEIALSCENQNIKTLKNTNDIAFEFKNLNIGLETKIPVNLMISPSSYLEFRYHDSRLKEQLIGLLLKNEELRGGDISVGGISYKDLSSLEVRNLVHNIDEPIVFEGTVRENLLDFDQTLDVSFIYEVLRKFDLDERILAFPNQLDQKLHAATGLLSYSQKYRLSLARIYIHEPSLLTLQTTKEIFYTPVFKKYIMEFKQKGCSVISFINDESISELYDFRELN